LVKVEFLCNIKLTGKSKSYSTAYLIDTANQLQT
jgi:hypothetical protein